MPVKISMPKKSFHLNEGISQAEDHFEPKAQSLKPKAERFPF